jgi:hypothetical protein
MPQATRAGQPARAGLGVASPFLDFPGIIPLE